jgi:hypothetical protein
VILESGKSYVGQQDGIITADGTVFKCADDADMTVSMNKDGNYIFSGVEEENVSGNRIKVAVNITRIFIRESRFFLEEQDLFGRYRLDYSDRADDEKFPSKWINGDQKIDHDNDKDTPTITGTILPDTQNNKDNSAIKPKDVEKHWNDLQNKAVPE